MMKSTEEEDLERKGYKLTNICLSKGSYAKVKLAHVMIEKLKQNSDISNVILRKGSNVVAVKIISHKQATKEGKETFIASEIDAMFAMAGSQHAIQLYEMFATNGRTYLIMEHASKDNLIEYMSHSTEPVGIGEEKAKFVFKQLVNGLLHCHDRNIVLRNLKCGNILIDGDNEVVKISNFGFAACPAESAHLLETYYGSGKYAAPEVLKQEKYDGRVADIWSLGVILFAMLNGSLPSENKTNLHIAKVSDECKDLVNRILTADTLKRATLIEILDHPWFGSSNSTQTTKLKGPQVIVPIRDHVRPEMTTEKLNIPQGYVPTRIRGRVGMQRYHNSNYRTQTTEGLKGPQIIKAPPLIKDISSTDSESKEIKLARFIANARKRRASVNGNDGTQTTEKLKGPQIIEAPPLKRGRVRQQRGINGTRRVQQCEGAKHVLEPIGPRKY